MAKWKCNACADTEGGVCPCTYENPMLPDDSGIDPVCPINSEEAEFEVVPVDAAKELLRDAAPDMYEALKGTGGTPNISMVLKQIEMRRFDVAKSMLEEMDELNNNALDKAEGKE